MLNNPGVTSIQFGGVQGDRLSGALEEIVNLENAEDIRLQLERVKQMKAALSLESRLKSAFLFNKLMISVLMLVLLASAVFFALRLLQAFDRIYLTFAVLGVMASCAAAAIFRFSERRRAKFEREVLVHYLDTRLELLSKSLPSGKRTA